MKEIRVLGGREVGVVVAPRGRARGLPGRAGGAVAALARGMRLTLHYLLRPSTVVTQQYPENRATLRMFERFRGQLRLRHDEKGRMICNGCNFCEQACPNASIRIRAGKGAITGKTELDRFVWRMDSCTFCGACVQACPHDAIHFSNDFETSVYDRRLLVYSLNRYAGPAARFLAKAAPEELAKLEATMEPRGRYEGPVPLAGTALAGAPALGAVADKTGASGRGDG